MTTTVRPTGRARPVRKLETIGAVCRRLSDEFPDISISKIRYLEDQGLLSPRRTPGGYRLFSEEDIERLEAILRLQRDEFLPLRVIRQELATRLSPSRRGRAPADLAEHDPEIDMRELCERAHITRDLARDLEEFGLLAPSDSRWRALLHRSRCRDRRCLRQAGRFGNDGPAPEDVPHDGRSSGWASRPGRCSGPSFPEPGAPPGGPGGASCARSCGTGAHPATAVEGRPHDRGRLTMVDLEAKIRTCPTSRSRA